MSETIVATQPDIQYHPDYEKYQERSRRRKANETLETTVPVGFPQKLISPLVWEGKEVVKGEKWVYHLKDDQLQEIDAALKSFKGMDCNQSSLDLPLIEQLSICLSAISISQPFLFLVFGQFFETSRKNSTTVEDSLSYGGCASMITPEKTTSSFTPEFHRMLAASEVVSRTLDWQTEPHRCCLTSKILPPQLRLRRLAHRLILLTSRSSTPMQGISFHFSV